MVEGKGRTLTDHFIEYLARPDVVERMKPWQTSCDGLLRAFSGFCEQTVAVILRAAESPPSAGYEPFLVERNLNPVLARMISRLLVRRGRRRANERIRLPVVVGAIRFLGKPGRGRRAIHRKAEVLLAASEETSIIETIFDDANLRESEFIGLLKSVVEGGEVAWQRITEIAALVVPHLPSPRGRRITAASATHEFLLEELISVTGSQGYTWDPYREDFADHLTQATRREFACPRFSPQSAHRRLSRWRAAIDRLPREA